MKVDLAKLKANLAQDAFNMTIQQAHEQSICIQCKQSALARCYSPEGRREYALSGMCEHCFDQLATE